MEDEETTWRAMECFIRSGDSGAARYLESGIQTPPQPSGLAAGHLPLCARLLRMEDAQGRSYSSASPSIRLLLAILNKLYCTRTLLPALTQTAFKSHSIHAGDAHGRVTSQYAKLLLDCYLAAFLRRCDDHVTTSAPQLRASRTVDSQLAISIAVLLTLVADGSATVVDLVQIAAPPATYPYHYLVLFRSLMFVLSDSRLSIGPIRRSLQRSVLQQHVSLVLLPCSTLDISSGDSFSLFVALELASATAECARFLGEGTTTDPMDKAPLFVPAVLNSSLWPWCCQELRRACSSAENEVQPECVDVVCEVLRCATDVHNHAASTMIVSALESVLGSSLASDASEDSTLSVGNSSRATLQCKVLTAVLETCLEDVVLQIGPDHPVHAWVLRGVQALHQMLSRHSSSRTGSTSYSAEEEDVDAVLHGACTCLSVLIQTLGPTPLPTMVEGDDAEDFEYVSMEIAQGNETKQRVLNSLHEFLCLCVDEVAAALVGVIASRHRAWPDLIAWLDRRTEDDDFCVAYDDVVVALYETYGRLCRLERVGPAVDSGRCSSFCGTPLLSSFSMHSLLHSISTTSATMLLQQSALLPPALKIFFQEDTAPNVKTDEVVAAMGSLVHAIGTAVETQNALIASCAHICVSIRFMMARVRDTLNEDVNTAVRTVASLARKLSHREARDWAEEDGVGSRQVRWEAIRLLSEVSANDATTGSVTTLVASLIPEQTIQSWGADEQLEWLSAQLRDWNSLPTLFSLLAAVAQETLRAERFDAASEQTLHRANQRIVRFIVVTVCRMTDGSASASALHAYMSLLSQWVCLYPTCISTTCTLLSAVSILYKTGHATVDAWKAIGELASSAARAVVRAAVSSGNSAALSSETLRVLFGPVTDTQAGGPYLLLPISSRLEGVKMGAEAPIFFDMLSTLLEHDANFVGEFFTYFESELRGESGQQLLLTREGLKRVRWVARAFSEASGRVACPTAFPQNTRLSMAQLCWRVSLTVADALHHRSQSGMLLLRSSESTSSSQGRTDGHHHHRSSTGGPGEPSFTAADGNDEDGDADLLSAIRLELSTGLAHILRSVPEFQFNSASLRSFLNCSSPVAEQCLNASQEEEILAVLNAYIHL